MAMLGQMQVSCSTYTLTHMPTCCRARAHCIASAAAPTTYALCRCKCKAAQVLRRRACRLWSVARWSWCLHTTEREVEPSLGGSFLHEQAIMDHHRSPQSIINHLDVLPGQHTGWQSPCWVGLSCMDLHGLLHGPWICMGFCVDRSLHGPWICTCLCIRHCTGQAIRLS